MSLCVQEPCLVLAQREPEKQIRTLVLIILLSLSDSQLRRDLGTLRATLDNTTSKIKAEFQSLDSRGELGSHGVLGWSGQGSKDSPELRFLVLQLTTSKKGSVL